MSKATCVHVHVRRTIVSSFVYSYFQRGTIFFNSLSLIKRGGTADVLALVGLKVEPGLIISNYQRRCLELGSSLNPT